LTCHWNCELAACPQTAFDSKTTSPSGACKFFEREKRFLKEAHIIFSNPFDDLHRFAPAEHATRRQLQPSMPFEILHGALVLLCSRARFEGSEVAASARFRIDLAGIEPVLAGSQFANH
jgi:hypothetical protein